LPDASTIVMKFGGTSVEDAAAFARVAEIVGGATGRVVVVTSAMSRGTDALLDAVRHASAGDVRTGGDAVDGLVSRLSAVAAAYLAGDAHAAARRMLDEGREAVAGLLAVARDHPGTRLPLEDEIVSYGERMTAALLAEVLRTSGVSARAVDARGCIRTDAEYTRAAPLAAATRACTRDVPTGRAHTKTAGGALRSPAVPTSDARAFLSPGTSRAWRCRLPAGADLLAQQVHHRRGAEQVGVPSGRPQTARSCCSNCETAHASQV
jgi:hypothetical protein